MMKTQFIIYLCFSLFFIMFSATYSQIIPDFKVNDDQGSSDQIGSSIASDGNGNFVITWEDGRNGNGDIYAQRYSSDGVALGGNFRVNADSNTTTERYSAYITIDGNSNFVITWGDERNGNGDIYAQRYSSDGAALGGNFRVNDSVGIGSFPTISSDANGNFVITWGDERNGGYFNSDVYAQRYSSDGVALGGNFRVNADTGSTRQYDPCIATDGNGNFVIAWYDARNGGYDIYAQCYSSDGTPLSGNFKVTDAGPTAWHDGPSISTDINGNFVIAWTDFRNDDDDIYAQRYSSDGVAIGGNFKVNGDGRGGRFSSVSSDGNGNFVITWTDNRNGNDNIYAQLYLSDGSTVGDNYRVSTMGSSRTFRGTHFWNERIYTTWATDSNLMNDTTGYDVWANVLDVTSGPNIITSEDTLDFGGVFVGASKIANLMITNGGFESLIVSDIIPGSPEYSVDTTNFTLNINQSQQVEVTFTPGIIGPIPGNLTIYSNDPVEPVLTIELQGEGLIPPSISITPDSLSLAIQPGQTGSKTLTIHNNGGSNLYFDIFSGWGSQNYALQFDGLDDYVNIDDEGFLSFEISQQSYTVSCWVNFNSLPTYGDMTFLIDRNSTQNPSTSYTLQYRSVDPATGSNYSFMLEIWNGPFDIQVFGTTHPVIHEWYFISIVANTAIVKLYVNGQLEGEAPINISNTKNLEGTTIGRFAGGSYCCNLDGILDEVRIWNVARTQAEIQGDMYQELSGAEPGLVGYWQFNEAAGDTAFDRTANANHGTLQGGINRINSTAPINPEWLSVTPDSGICFPGKSKDITVSFNATELDTGNYFANLFITSNDPVLSQVTIPVHLWVSNTVDLYEGNNLPTVFNLHQNYPNPFNPSTTIEFALPKAGLVTLTIYNVAGEKVATLISENLAAGSYKYQWDARGLASGVYFYRLEAGDFRQTKKMLLLR